MIVDAHAHAFAAIQGAVRDGPTRGTAHGRVAIGPCERQVLPTSRERSDFPLSALRAHLHAAGVEAAVLLQGPFYGEQNAYVAEACRGDTRLAGMAYLDPWDVGARRVFDAIGEAAIFRGVKLECSEPTGLLGLHPGRRLDEPALEWLGQDLERRHDVLTLDLGSPGSGSYQTDAVRTIAARHPGLRIVLCHLCQPSPALEHDRALRTTWESQAALALLGNVWLDTAALPAYFAGERFPWPGALRALHRALDLVGPRKLMWGTDIPGLLVLATYAELRQQAEEALADLAAEDRARVMGGNAHEVYFPTSSENPRAAA